MASAHSEMTFLLPIAHFLLLFLSILVLIAFFYILWQIEWIFFPLYAGAVVDADFMK